MNTWSNLNHLQTGRYGEYFAKMAFVRVGFDVFSPEVDDKGIDFVLRVDGDAPRYYDVQVKSVRSTNTYLFMRKDKFRLQPNLLLALVVLHAGREPEIYLIPANAWRDAKPPFADRDYDGWRCQSKIEYSARPPDSNFGTIDFPRFFGSDPGGSAVISGIQNFALTMPSRARRARACGTSLARSAACESGRCGRAGGGRPVRQEQEQGMLAAALGVLAGDLEHAATRRAS